MPRLVLCGGCRRHFREHERACPFCGTATVEASVRPLPSLAASASRSRRYAASAALLAGGALYACGGSTNDAGNTTSGGSHGAEAGRGSGGANSAGGESTSGGKSSTGGAAPSGGSGGSGNANGSGGSQGGRTEGEGGASESGGVNSSTGGVSSAGTSGTGPGRACEGHVDRPGCRTASDCPAAPGSVEPATCVMVLPPRPCGNPSFLPSCPEEGCGDGMMCRPLPCGESCEPVCDESTCQAPNHCVDGFCRRKPCDDPEGVTCAEGFECDPTATEVPSHCVPIRCSDARPCKSFQTCGAGAPRDAFDCGNKACTADADCGDCGYCVNAACQPTLGICHQFLAMPYGCVWPDEELI